MENKRDFEARAKGLLETNPDESLNLYHELWEKFPEQFNSWDAYFAIKAMRASTTPNVIWASELAEKFNEGKASVGNLYGWLIFERCVKGKNRNELLRNENLILRLPSLSPQKNRREDDTYPCPTTISILNIAKVYAKPNLNALKVESFLSQLNVDYLSQKPSEAKNNEDDDDEFASDFEKYCSLRTKALLKTKCFQECKDLSEKALKGIEKFHYNNDTWFKMRLALAEEGLGNHDVSERQLTDLLESKAGNDKWFLYHDVAEIYFEAGEFSKSWKYAVDATFYGNEPHFLINLYLLQARILFKLNRSSEGKILAELIAAILKEQNWPEKNEHSKLFDYYKIDKTKLESVEEIIKGLRKFWQIERYGNKPKLKGTIITIHKSGKTGIIKDQDGKIIGFHKKDLVKKVKSIEDLNGSLVEFYVMPSFDGKSVAENITITSKPSIPVNAELVGKIYDGIVKNVTEFGIFIRLEKSLDGLLHKNNLPNELKGNLKDNFPQGNVVRVKIDRVTAKGINLKLIEKY